MPTNLIMENRDWQHASDIQGADQKVKSSFVLKVAAFVFSSLFIFSGLVVSYKAITEKPMGIGGIVLGFVHMGLGLTIGFITYHNK